MWKPLDDDMRANVRSKPVFHLFPKATINLSVRNPEKQWLTSKCIFGHRHTASKKVVNHL